MVGSQRAVHDALSFIVIAENFPTHWREQLNAELTLIGYVSRVWLKDLSVFKDVGATFGKTTSKFITVSRTSFHKRYKTVSLLFCSCFFITVL